MKTPRRWIRIKQYPESWMPFKMAGKTPVGTGDCYLREPQIPCLFRRSNNSRQIRWDRTQGERRTN